MRALAVLSLALAACAPAARGGHAVAPGLAPAPWAGPRLRAADVPAPYLAAWRAAANRATCALLAPRTLGEEGPPPGAATPRAATFGGGWGVAYDVPGTRSAFGVAGTGAGAGEPGTYDQWPQRRTWADGSRVGYGPEGGGASDNTLAYLTIPGQGCLYNVWSRLGRAHLESLLAELRFVDTGS